jgi:hypothetical protein
MNERQPQIPPSSPDGQMPGPAGPESYVANTHRLSPRNLLAGMKAYRSRLGEAWSKPTDTSPTPTGINHDASTNPNTSITPFPPTALSLLQQGRAAKLQRRKLGSAIDALSRERNLGAYTEAEGGGYSFRHQDPEILKNARQSRLFKRYEKGEEKLHRQNSRRQARSARQLARYRDHEKKRAARREQK